MVFFSSNEYNAVILPHSTQRKHECLVKKTRKSQNQKSKFLKIFSLELLHHRLGHRSKRSLLAGDTVNVWEYIDTRVGPDPLFTSY